MKGYAHMSKESVISLAECSQILLCLCNVNNLLKETK